MNINIVRVVLLPTPAALLLNNEYVQILGLQKQEIWEVDLTLMSIVHIITAPAVCSVLYIFHKMRLELCLTSVTPRMHLIAIY